MSIRSDAHSTIQLRRYQIRPGELDAFLSWWKSTLWPARERFGFGLEFAYVIAEEDAFVWAVSCPGGPDEFAAAENAWLESEDRARTFVDVPERVMSKRIDLVQPVLVEHGML